MSFDQSSRSRLVARILRHVGRPGERVAEIGGGPAGALAAWCPELEVTRLDSLLEPPEGVAFDHVVCLDTLDLVPAAQRAGFLRRLAALARRGIVVAGPCADAGDAAATDEWIREVYRRCCGHDHPVLAEHVRLGLPSLQQILSVFTGRGLECEVWQQGHTPWLRRLAPAALAAAEMPELQGPVEAIERYFGEHLAELDRQPPCYRQVVYARPAGGREPPDIPPPSRRERAAAERHWAEIERRLLALPAQLARRRSAEHREVAERVDGLERELTQKGLIPDSGDEPAEDRPAGAGPGLAELSSRLLRLRRHLASLVAEREQSQQVLAQIYRSRSWRALHRYWSARRGLARLRRLLPGTTRRRTGLAAGGAAVAAGAVVAARAAPSLEIRLYRLYGRLPLSGKGRRAIKNLLFSRLPFLFRRFAAHQRWREIQGISPHRASPAPAEHSLALEDPELDRLQHDPAFLRQRLREIAFEEPSTPRVSVVVPVFEKLHFTVRCLEALVSAVSAVAAEVIVVDDGSADATPELLPEVPGLRYLRLGGNSGFPRAANRGLEAARGEYVLFLNNDALLHEGALQALLAVFESRPEAGAAGPKFVYPGGALQEAGAALRADGSVEMVGLNDDPERKVYGLLREVQHSSASCLLAPRELLAELGGFDEAYSPGYYEDCDLSMRIRAAGRRIYYQPRAVVTHHLSATYGERKRRLEDRRRIFLDRWGARLRDEDRVRAIAFFLPQFHPIPENDAWWGKGFTEWTNVTRARPLFPGHRQPRVPTDLGHYDLRVPEVRASQAELARAAGLHGFCFYYYWFNGRRLLFRPLAEILRSGEPDFPFCVCWANENWTRRWDGREHDVLLAQHYSPEDDVAFIRSLFPLFQDRRYIRVDGRPLLLVYRVALLPDPAATVRRWRRECRAAGFDAIYVVSMETFEGTRHEDPANYGFDAVLEFPPHGRAVPATPPPGVAAGFGGQFYDYPATAEAFVRRDLPDYTLLRSVMPDWDNTARRGLDAHVFLRSSAAAYERWLAAAVRQTRHLRVGDERLLFVNAWNEWAEGNYLEPDEERGHDYLEATRRALAVPAAESAEVAPPGAAPAREIPARRPRVRAETPTALVGHPYSISGVGEYLRSVCSAFDAAGLPFTIHDVYGPLGDAAEKLPDFPYRDLIQDGPGRRVNIFHMNADEMAPVHARLGDRFFRGRHNIACWHWELSEFPDRWSSAFDLVDEIWAPSRFIQNAIARKAPCPVRHVSHCVEFERPAELPRSHYGLPAESFVFLATADFTSYMTRKNPLAALAAFRAAFPASSPLPVVFVLKLNGASLRPDQYRAFRELPELRDPRVRVIDGVISDREMQGLLETCDCFVSLHRSEGFGRGMAGAMFFAKPVIATAYSGNLDFTHEGNSLLVDYRLVPVGPDEYPCAEGQHWADPDVDAAARRMRQVVTDPQTAARVGERAAELIRTHHGAAAIGARYHELLAGLLAPREPAAARAGTR